MECSSMVIKTRHLQLILRFGNEDDWLKCCKIDTSKLVYIGIMITLTTINPLNAYIWIWSNMSSYVSSMSSSNMSTVSIRHMQRTLIVVKGSTGPPFFKRPKVKATHDNMKRRWLRCFQDVSTCVKDGVKGLQVGLRASFHLGQSSTKF